MNQTHLARSYSSDNFQAFYTDADEIRFLMQELLGNVEGKTVLEPCAGEGAFLDGLSGTPKLIRAIDIDSEHIASLEKRFGAKLTAIHADFIDIYVSGPLGSGLDSLSSYDAVICNPPYGLKFTLDYRKKIKHTYPDLYARESYGLFLYFGIAALSGGGRFVYIVPDTFFTSRNHASLRRFLAENTRISDIIQFKSKRFETVNFGYGNLCIVAGNKQNPNVQDVLRWADARSSKENLRSELYNNSDMVLHNYLLENVETGWVHPVLSKSILLPKGGSSLGDMAECRTGIYTGDNQNFCAYDSSRPPSRANGHPLEWDKCVKTEILTDHEKQYGLVGDKNYVPFVRGGHREPFEETLHAIDWSVNAVNFYRDNKKARLQNQGFYFRQGLAIPMVTSGRLSASLMDQAVFDQGVVGVFPHDVEMIPFLLIYLNSSVASKMKAAINPGANNSANYIKRIQVPPVDSGILERARCIVASARRDGWVKSIFEREAFINELVNR